jgi:hypothetical protein
MIRKAALWHILVVALWINLAETVRWILFAKPQFDEFYRSMGLVMPNAPANNILWMIWGIILAFTVYTLSETFSLLKAALITWFAVYVMTWIALWNFAVLPTGLLISAIPLTLFSLFIAAWISKRLQRRRSA